MSDYVEIPVGSEICSDWTERTPSGTELVLAVASDGPLCVVGLGGEGYSLTHRATGRAIAQGEVEEMLALLRRLAKLPGWDKIRRRKDWRLTAESIRRLKRMAPAIREAMEPTR